MGTPVVFSSSGIPVLFNVENLSKPRDFIMRGEDIYFIANDEIKNIGRLYSGKRRANSSSIGPFSFSPSIGYVQEETTGSYLEKFDLLNVSEWPHAGGLFQMKNMVIGTSTTGKIGLKEDSIIQVKHIGSTVKIMWPRQQNADATVKGYRRFIPRASCW